MLPLRLQPLKSAAWPALIVIVAAALGGAGHRLEQRRLDRTLVGQTEIAAVGFAAAAAQGEPAQAALQRQLQRLAAADSTIRFASVLQPTSAGRMLRIAEFGVPADAPDPTPETARTVTPPSVMGHQGAGDRLTTYARLDSPAGPDRPNILRIDYDIGDWSRRLGFTALRTALLSALLLWLPWFAWRNRRHRGEQREVIRNLSEAIEQGHSAILIVDLVHQIEYASRGLCHQIGYARHELLGHPWTDFISGPAAEPMLAEMKVTIANGHPWEGEWENRRKNGTTYPARIHVSPVRHRDGRLACFVALLDDISEAKRTEAELREARDLAEAADRAKSQFLATMSHEVRTPLNGIVGFTSLLLDTPLSAEQREFVQTIRSSSEALIQITGDILDFARIESGKLKLNPVACDPRDCVEEALDLHAAAAAQKQIELLHATAADVPAGVMVDAGRLRQVLTNLVGNAVKFTDRGEVQVSTAVGPLPAAAPVGGNPEVEACMLEFSVRDTGTGIAPNQFDRLFKPFSQLDESTTRRHGGAGLGLAISRHLLRLMNGTVEVTSEPGKGTTFVVRFPAVVCAPPPRPRRLDALRIALAIHPGSLRRELVALLQSWNAQLLEADTPDALPPPADWDIALVEVDEASAREMVARAEPLPGLPPAQAVALVPISLPSELRSGLRQHFRLLVNRPLHQGPLFALLSGTRPTETAPAPANKYGFRVLLVEDNEVNRRVVHRMLQGLGCSTVLAGDGREAIAALSQADQSFDVVLLDLHLPEMDGLAALECIRRGDAGERARQVWTIAVTAEARPEERSRALAAGLNDYVTKPFHPSDLEAALRRYRAERLTVKR